VFATLAGDPAGFDEKTDRNGLEQAFLKARYFVYIDLALKAMASEAREKFQRLRPATLDQAARIPGITPADISALRIHLHSKNSI
jgi:tRNA uridine 5-carboxymethylaminomethyl modification enzyme